MAPVRRAVIDVGTNSVKLLVGDVLDGYVQPVHEASKQTRLGQGFYSSHRLQPGPIALTADAVARFGEAARAQGATSLRVIGTSAVRDALNTAELADAIAKASGLKLQVISGSQEANWAFRGATTEPSLATPLLFIADVGGGSAQFIIGRGSQTFFEHSYDLGTVRLLETMPPHDPPSSEELTSTRSFVRQLLEARVKPDVDAAISSTATKHQDSTVLVGTGGTASILGCMEARLDHFDRNKLEQTQLTAERLSWHTEHLWSLSLRDRRQIVGLPANRADVILPGAVIFEQIAAVFGFARLRISTRGLRFAALLES